MCVCVDLVTRVLLCSASFTNEEQRVWPLNADIMITIVIIRTIIIERGIWRKDDHYQILNLIDVQNQP